MKKLYCLLWMLCILLLFVFSGCQKAPAQQETQFSEASETTDPVSETKETKEMQLYMRVKDTEVQVDWEENETVDALKKLAEEGELTVELSMYGGFEQVGPLGTSLPHKDAQITTVSGDVVLYSGNQIVVFYGPNSWAYTRIGHITDKTPAEMQKLLGNGDVSIVFYCAE
ncbi:MAG: hypothetical protein IKF18_05510 [Erysipelotrichaceae bacterium]|nr:hypothetical protein [Erysipelotrichaceae bacterium]